MSGKTHGLSNTRIYKIWECMKYRCSNPNRPEYPNYGGRGIIVCDEWANNFLSFYEWSMSNGYNESLTIDRIDVNGNYEPDNCRWTDMKTQANNTTRCIYITYQDKTQTLTQWCEELNLSYDTIRTRLRRDANITPERLFRPVGRYKKSAS